jgi:3-phenylpropionate/cinnamic acid dioxygenase small subunit
VTPKIQLGASKALNVAVVRTISAADPLTPVDTGMLRSNKQIVNASMGALVASVNWVQFYAIYQEMGTIYFPGNFYARTGSEHATPGLLADMAAVGFTLGGG